MSQWGNMVLKEPSLLGSRQCGVYFKNQIKKYPGPQFSSFLSSGWTTGFRLGLRVREGDKWQSGEETTAAVENENQYFCGGGVLAQGEEK